MPWRYIVFLLVLVVIGVFWGFNASNNTVLSLGFVELSSVNVTLVAVISFVIGGFTGLLFAFFSMQNWKKKTKKKVLEQNAPSAPANKKIDKKNSKKAPE